MSIRAHNEVPNLALLRLGSELEVLVSPDSPDQQQGGCENGVPEIYVTLNRRSRLETNHPSKNNTFCSLVYYIMYYASVVDKTPRHGLPFTPGHELPSV